MDSPDPFPNPFGNLGEFLQSMLGSLGAAGPLNADVARQWAMWLASQGQSEPNVDPLERMRLEELARVAELHVGEATGLMANAGGEPVSVLPVTRAEWARRTLDDYRPMLDDLAASLGRAMADESEPEPNPSTDLLGGLGRVLAPVLLGMQTGTMVGHLATRAFGQYDLPIPRAARTELLLVPATIDAFAEEWSLPPDDLRLWVALREVTSHAVLGREHVRAALLSLLREHASGFEPSEAALDERFGAIDPTDPESFQKMLGDPEGLIGAMQSDAQRALLPRIDAITAAVVGYVDHIMDTVGGRLITTYDRVTEAVRRRRVEAAAGDRYVARLLGIELGQRHYERGAAFVDGVVERAGQDGLRRLWESERELPTPAELDAPGLWLARIDLPTDV
jgi:putative hydrolase